MVKIFVGRLVDSVTKDKLKDMFSKYGEVIDCEVLKNFAFVHMAEKSEAEKAIRELDKTDLEGQTINVEFSVTKVASAAKLFVGNLAEGTKSCELHKLFKKYGTVIECDVIKNYAFVHMSKEVNAREAIDELNDYDLNGNKIRVQMARTRGPGGRGGGYNNGPMRPYGRGGGMYGPGPRYNPYGHGYDDGYDMQLPPRSRNYQRGPVGRMPAYDYGMGRGVPMGGRRDNRSGPSYVRLLRERALLTRRLMNERSGAASFRDSYSSGYSSGAGLGNGSSRLSRASSAYTDFAVDEFDDITLGDGFDLDGGAFDRYGGPAAYGYDAY